MSNYVLVKLLLNTFLIIYKLRALAWVRMRITSSVTPEYAILVAPIWLRFVVVPSVTPEYASAVACDYWVSMRSSLPVTPESVSAVA